MAGSVQLRRGDERALLALAGELATCEDARQWSDQTVGLAALAGAETVMVTGCVDWARSVTVEVGAPELTRGELLDVVGRHWQDHLVMAPDLARPGRGVRRLSDFLPERTWRRRALFNDFYRPLGLGRELSLQVSWGPVGTSCCLALFRGGSDFSERDRKVVELAAPSLVAARARLAAEAAAASRMDLIEARGDGLRRGVLVLDREGRAAHLGGVAEELLRSWFAAAAGAVPADLLAWWREARKDPAAATYESERGDQVLRITLLRGKAEDLLVLVERERRPEPDRLAHRLGLSPREAEVLSRLAAGRTNDGIALDLGISRHTVVRHVESIYGKLDVHTRAAATRAALDALADR